MRRLLAIAMHPWLYCQFRKTQEQMVLLWAACEMLHIEEPSVWDVDRLNEVLNKILEALHEDPHLLDGSKIVCDHLFWTRLVSRFKRLEISREGTKSMMDMYNFTVNNIDSAKPTVSDVVVAHVAMTKMFGKLV